MRLHPLRRIRIRMIGCVRSAASIPVHLDEIVFLRRFIAGSLVALSTLVATSARAQFVVEQSSPAIGAVNVPLTDTIAFAFSEEVDISLDWNTVFQYEPRDSVRVTRLAVCLNFEGECGGGSDVPRFVRYTVQHQPETDYTWMVYAARSADGEAMTTPYVLRYTTASTIGERTVSGSLLADPGKSGDVTAAQTATLKRLAAFVERRDAGARKSGQGPEPHFDARPTQARIIDLARAGSARLAPPTHVYLVDSFTSDESQWSIRAGTLTESTSYQVEYVRPGVYSSLAVRYRDATHDEIEALGFYDPDGDGLPDSIAVDEADLADVDLTMFEFPLTTAKTYLTQARDAAATFAADQDLITVASTDGGRPSGEAYAWTYTFYSPGTERLTTVQVDPLEVQADTSMAPLHVPPMLPIGDAFTDSDVALAAVADDGGEEFWGEYPLRNLTTTIEAGHFYWLDSPDPDRVVWHIQVAVATSSETRTFERFVDIHTGAVLHTGAEEQAAPHQTGAEPAYPNPFHNLVHIPFELSNAAPVTIEVHDALGRRVATPLRDVLHQPGKHQAVWAHPAVAAGVYVYRIIAGDYVRTGRLIRAAQ